MQNLQQNDSHTYNIRDKYEENDEVKKISFNILSNIINIPIYKLLKYSELIQEEFIPKNIFKQISQKIEQIKNHINIEDSQFASFLKLLNEEDVTIDDKIFCDFYKLSQIFKVKSIQKFLFQYSQEHSDDINFIIHLMGERENKSDDYFPLNDDLYNDHENFLSNNINKCFQNGKFGNLPISTIHRIIEKSDKNLMDNNLLYEFIKKSIETRFILFAFLD